MWRKRIQLMYLAQLVGYKTACLELLSHLVVPIDTLASRGQDYRLYQLSAPD
jgi:hypothetical protein